ncbi:MAG: isochorismatase family protein, partial [Pseudomonadota bacterium]
MMHLNEEKVGLLIVDVQGALARKVNDSQTMICKTVKLIQCCKLLNIPVVVLEQNPDGLERTVPEIETHVASDPHFKKFTFNKTKVSTSITPNSENCQFFQKFDKKTTKKLISVKTVIYRIF